MAVVARSGELQRHRQPDPGHVPPGECQWESVRVGGWWWSRGGGGHDVGDRKHHQQEKGLPSFRVASGLPCELKFGGLSGAGPMCVCGMWMKRGFWAVLKIACGGVFGVVGRQHKSLFDRH